MVRVAVDRLKSLLVAVASLAVCLGPGAGFALCACQACGCPADEGEACCCSPPLATNPHANTPCCGVVAESAAAPGANCCGVTAGGASSSGCSCDSSLPQRAPSPAPTGQIGDDVGYLAPQVFFAEVLRVHDTASRGWPADDLAAAVPRHVLFCVWRN